MHPELIGKRPERNSRRPASLPCTSSFSHQVQCTKRSPRTLCGLGSGRQEHTEKVSAEDTWRTRLCALEDNSKR